MNKRLQNADKPKGEAIEILYRDCYGLDPVWPRSFTTAYLFEWTPRHLTSPLRATTVLTRDVNLFNKPPSGSEL